MWIVGGDVNQGHYQNDVWNSADGKTWTLVNKGKPVPWGPRALHYTVAFKRQDLGHGRPDDPAVRQGDEMFYRDVWTSTDGVDWEQVDAEGAVLAAARHDRRQRGASRAASGFSAAAPTTRRRSRRGSSTTTSGARPTA